MLYLFIKFYFFYSFSYICSGGCMVAYAQTISNIFREEKCLSHINDSYSPIIIHHFSDLPLEFSSFKYGSYGVVYMIYRTTRITHRFEWWWWWGCFFPQFETHSHSHMDRMTSGCSPHY